MSVKYAPIVQLDKGLVRGIVQEVDDSEIYFYQGIRYGRANRFEKPTPVEQWTGVYDATTVRPNPPQLGLEVPRKGHFSFTISEDCLMLNVWKPIRESSAPLPVMVYIFGGKCQTGSILKLTNELRWLAHRGGVIGVAMNYRIGPFGYMFGDDHEAPANLGFHDQILALRWIQENISKFGGDSNSVTIFGNSAGALTVGALILSPLTKGLFHRASLQFLHPLEIQHKNESLHIIKSIAQYLNCDNSNMSQLVANLKSKSIEDILNATQELKLGFNLVYGDEALHEKPLDTLLSGSYNTDIDLMYGSSRDDGAVFVLEQFPELKDESIKLTLQTTREYIDRIVGEQHENEAADFYLKASGLNHQSDPDDFRRLVYQIFGDLFITASVILFGEQHAKHQHAKLQLSNHKKVFAWQLVQPAEYHVVGLITSPKLVCHADELFYLFIIPKQTKPEDFKLSHQLCQAWTQFAKVGDPGSVGNVQWTEAVDKDGDFTTKLITLGYESKMVSGFHREMSNFWKGILFADGEPTTTRWHTLTPTKTV